MPAVTLSVEADVATRADGHRRWRRVAPAGRLLVGCRLPLGHPLPAPSGWDDWTAITKATLTFYISDHQHVAPKNSSHLHPAQLTVRHAGRRARARRTASRASAARQQHPVRRHRTRRRTNQVSFSSGSTANATKSVAITAHGPRLLGNDSSSKIVFIFDNGRARSDYTELWADEKSGYNAELDIEYEDDDHPRRPDAGRSGCGASGHSRRPRRSTGRPQRRRRRRRHAEVQLYDAGGVAIGSPWSVAGATSALVSPVDPDPGRRPTSGAARPRTRQGWGAVRGQATFTRAGHPGRHHRHGPTMEFAAGEPRLHV